MSAKLNMPDVIAYLLGEGTLEGYWWSEKPTYAAPYWWRSALRICYEAQAKRIKELEAQGEKDAELVESMANGQIDLTERIKELEALIEPDLMETGLALAEKLANALRLAGKRFRFYEEAHKNKTPPDTVKAENNREYAEMCEQALSEYAAQKGGK
jgi:hypothetical protein